MTAPLFELPAGSALTLADLDEWIADVEASRYDTTHYPAEWAREGLGAILGETFPYRLYRQKELLGLLTRARRCVTSAGPR